jgi:hypothetical protein
MSDTCSINGETKNVYTILPEFKVMITGLNWFKAGSPDGHWMI